VKQLIVLLVAASALFAQCPLGFTPEGACSSSAPSCALFNDANEDGFCDNARPQVFASEEEKGEDPEESAETDTVTVEDGEEEAIVTDLSCPLNLLPADACVQETARCTFFTDSNADGFCDNPGPQPVAAEETEQEEAAPDLTEEQEQTEGDATEEIETELPDTAETVDTTDTTETVVAELESSEPDHLQNSCPLQYTVDEACDSENPQCTFFVDDNDNGFCDNPGPDSLQGEVHTDTTVSRGFQIPSVIGCPLGLPPAAACPDSLALCPHWYGVTNGTVCSNPSGGLRRINIVLIALGFLLPVSTWLSRRFYGRSLKDRLKRNTAHHIVRGVSLMILGFGVQGCFCPLGTFQYAFTAGGLAFLGISGMVIFLLPLIFSMFFGRVFCGWVCPFGALQEFLYKIHVPGRFSPSGKVHDKLRHLNTVILFALITSILLDRYDMISIGWPAPFCSIDPFHTIFTLFLSGSLVIAGVTIILSIFIRRFFCKYLCFYGAAQSILARLTLWNRIKGNRSLQPEPDSDEEFDK
jgi:hypothetical protein